MSHTYDVSHPRHNIMYEQGSIEAPCSRTKVTMCMHLQEQTCICDHICIYQPYGRISRDEYTIE